MTTTLPVPARARSKPSGTSPSSKIKVSVVICAYTEDRWDDLVAAVGSVQRQTVAPSQVIVVVDHCPALFARSIFVFENVVVLENSGERGLSGARNTGIGEATGDVVAFLDDDAEADSAWLESLVAAYSDRDVLGVGGLVDANWTSARPAWFPPEFDWVVGCSYTGMPSETGPVRNFIGTNMSFRRLDLLESGGFHTELGRNGANGAGCEETELCIRLTASAGHLVYEPAARVLHSVGPDRCTWKYFVKRCFAEGHSKAAVAGHTGARAALETERSYVRRVIPKAVVGSLLGRRTSGVANLKMTLALVGGVLVTTLGYLLESSEKLGVRFASAVRVARRRLRVALKSALSAPTLPGYAGLLVILGLWASVMARGVSLSRMTDLGLLTVLPIAFWVSLAGLMVSFCWWIQRRNLSQRLMLAHVLVLIVLLHVTPVLLYGTLRYAWAWRHVGIVDYILHHGGANLHLTQETVYQDWPGFFSLNALLTSSSGLRSALSYAAWGPPVFELLYLGPLLLIFRTLTTEKRLQWTAVWIFYLGNWIGQDYFSPQAFSYFLYLVVIAICLRWYIPLRRAHREAVDGLSNGPAEDQTPVTTRRLLARIWPGFRQRTISAAQHSDDGSDNTLFFKSRARRRAAFLMVLPILFAIASTHQLTPFILIVALAALAITKRIRYRSLPIILVLFTTGWILLATRTFLNQNLSWIVQSIGQPLGNATASLASVSQADPSEVLIANIDQLATAMIVVLALISLWRSRKKGWIEQLQIPVLLLCVPLVALVATSYGSEIRLRVFFFALPFLALFAAVAIAPLSGKHRAGTSTGNPHRIGWATLGRFVVIMLLLLGFMYPYYGKEQTNYFSPQEVSVMEHLYATAPAGSLVIAANNNLPWSFEHYAAYQYEWFGSSTAATTKAVDRSPVAWLTRAMENYPHAFLIFSQSQEAADAFNGIMPRGALARIQSDVSRSKKFTPIVTKPSIQIYQLAKQARP